jgi:hypothetical protein
VRDHRRDLWIWHIPDLAAAQHLRGWDEHRQAIAQIRRAGSDRLSMKTAIVVKIASTTAIPAASAVRTVEAASRPDRNRTI